MLLEGVRERNQPEGETGRGTISGGELLMQGIATSIDALSVGFTFAGYSFFMANLAGVIIAGVTFLLCMISLAIGKKVGMSLSWKASVLGGCILIAIGLEIFISGML